MFSQPVRTTRSREGAQSERTDGIFMPTNQKKPRSLGLAVFVLSVLLLLALSVAGYFYYQYRQSPKVQSTEEIAELKEKVGRIFELPTNEEPTLATVTDREKLAEQPFFQKAENGDKVLIYSASGRAILYRPSVEKIIDVTNVNVNQPKETGSTETSTTPAPVRVVLYNGTTILGRTNTTEVALKNAVTNVTIVGKENAAKDDYTETMVINLGQASESTTLAIATALGGQVGSLPEGETLPADADILVIIGTAE